MKFFKSKSKRKKRQTMATVTEMTIIKIVRTYGEDDAEQIKAANQMFLDAVVPLDFDVPGTQSAFLLDESLRDWNHPRNVRRRRRQQRGGSSSNILLQMEEDDDESLPEIELPPDMGLDDPMMIEAILAQRQWERQQRRASQMTEHHPEDGDGGDFDFDSEYSSDSERDYDYEDDDRSYGDNDSSSYDDDDISQSTRDGEDDCYSSQDEQESSLCRPQDDYDDDQTPVYSQTDLEDEESSQSYFRDDDDVETSSYSREEPEGDDNFSDECSERNERQIDDGVRKSKQSNPEERSRRDDESDNQNIRAERYDEDDDDSHGYSDKGSAAACSQDDDQGRYGDSYRDIRGDSEDSSRSSVPDDILLGDLNASRHRSDEDVRRHSDRYRDDSSCSSYSESDRDDNSMMGDLVGVPPKHRADEDNRSDDFSRGDADSSGRDDDASEDSRSSKNDRLSGSASKSQAGKVDDQNESCYDYADDEYLHQREEEEEQELATLEEARQNLPDGEQMHPFLLEHYMALKERKVARRRLSQRASEWE